MRKTHTCITALLGALALTASGISITGCSHDSSGGSSGGGGGNTGGNYSTLTAERKSVTAPEAAGTITVSGGASYTGSDINAAWAAIKSATGDVTMTLAEGTYTVTAGTQLVYSGSHNIKISGAPKTEYGLDVLIKGNPNTASQGLRELLYLNDKSTGSLTLEYVTLENEYGRDLTNNVQAEVIGTDGTGNVAAYSCSFISRQDTIRTVAKAWFYHCYIEGDVDFLWMEKSGRVALYENCVIRAVGDRVKNAYFTAPRAALTTRVGKGLVIYNSVLEAEAGLGSKVYLARNPWSDNLTGQYNNVAIVSTPLYLAPGASLNADIWAAAANGTSDQQYVGYKTDDYYAKSAKYGARLSAAVKSAEYAGRRNILNREYNMGSKKFVKDTDSNWDIDALITANGWQVALDSSKDLLAGEKETVIKVYDFGVENAGAWSDSDVSASDFSYHANSKAATSGAGKTITIPLTGKAVVYVSGCYSGYGTIKAANQKDEVVYDFNNNSTNTVIEKVYTVYEANPGNLVITTATTTYITKIVVEYDDTLTYTPVSAIAVSGDSTTYTVGVSLKLSAAVTPGNATNTDVKWSSSNAAVGTVDEYTGDVKFIKAGTVTFTATARDGSGKTGTITCTPKEATWTSAEWYDKKVSSSSTSGSGTGLGGSAGENNSIFTLGTGIGGVTLGGVKKVNTISGTEVNISTGIKMNSSGTVTFSVTKNATVLVKTGYCSDENKTDDTLKITASDGATATADSGNPSETPTTDADYNWTLTPGTYTVGRAGGGYAPSIYYVRVDITE